ncbi:MAG TPA: LLM class flavin-dependent oxidoreductase [Chloroflexota bacterium]|nr:LLM class flavin-dependent oxidoreductase [Chloroflexota bacterium]
MSGREREVRPGADTARAPSRALRFGIWDWLDHNRRVDLADLYEQRLRMVEYADRVGFYGYHLAEHHGIPLSMSPSPNLFFVAVAQRTRRLRFGSMVYLLPFYNPLRLVEEVCMLDHLSRGRLDLGIGRPATPYEMAMFNVAPDESRPIMTEVLDVLLMGLRTGEVNYEGKYLQLRDVAFTMRPFQRPYPPLWYPTVNAQTVPWIAREGLNTIYGFSFLSGTLEDTRQQLATYERVWQEHRAAPGRLNEHVPDPLYGFTRQVYVAETEAQALAEAKEAYLDFYANFNYQFAKHGSDRYAHRAAFEPLVEQGLLLAGSPATVRARLQEIVQAVGGNYFLGTFAFGSLSTEQVLRSIRLFAEEVMPALTSALRVDFAR